MVCDRVRLKQIVVNLVSNAIKFTPSGTVTVEVDCDEEAKRFRISVIDTGTGIAQADAERIFEPFDQLQHGALEAATGTGLGLAIVRRLCDLLGGTVALQSEVGRGSRFTVELPRVMTVAPPGEAANPQAAPGRR
jgi:signal transduction histidine kinase